MRIEEALSDSPAGRAIIEAARRQGAAPEQVRTAIATIVPELTRHIERNTLSRGGLADLIAALGAPQHTASLTNPNFADDPHAVTDGNAILGHIVGGKGGSRTIAAHAAQASGLSESLIKMLLPFIASMLMSALQRYLQGGLGDILKRLPGGTGSGSGNSDSPMQFPRGGRPSGDDGGFSGRGFELPQQGPIDGIPDRGGARPPLETPREVPPQRSPFDPPTQSAPDEQRSPGSIPQQVPPSMPGDFGRSSGRSPFDDISDILRRGSGPKVSGDQTVRRSVRDLIGNALGFSKGGVMSWIIRLLVVRFGWGILKRLLGRAFGAR